MKSPVPELSPPLARALAAFREAGVELTAAEIVWLALLRRPCDHPIDGSLPWLIGAPFNYAGVTWYPTHQLAELWFIRVKKLLTESDSPDLAHTTAFLFAHAHSAPGDVTVRSLNTLEEIEGRCMEWFNGLPLHVGQVLPLVNRLRELDRNTTSVPDGSDSDHSDEVLTNQSSGVAVMMKAFPGTTPEFWLTEVAACDARAYVHAVGEQSKDFATSEGRRKAIENYLKAIKWVWSNHTNG